MSKSITKYLIYSIWGAALLGQLGRLPLGNQYINVYLTEVLVAILILTFLLTLPLSRALKIRLPQSYQFLFVFMSLAFFSLLVSSATLSLKQTLASALYLFRFVAYVGLGLITYNLVSSEPAKKQGLRLLEMTRFVVVISLLLGLIGLVQLVVLPDFTNLDPAWGWDPHQNRLAATFLDPNFLGAFLVIGFGLTFSYLISGWSLFSRKVDGLICIILSVFVVLTFSRSAYLMVAVVVGLLGILKTWKMLPLAVGVFLLAYLMVPRVQTRIAGGVDPDDSARARIVSWSRTIAVIKNHPLTGVGFNSLRYENAKRGYFDKSNPWGGRSGSGSDSGLLFVWATTGLGGVLAFALFLAHGIFLSFQSYWRHRASIEGVFFLGSGVCLLALLVQSNFINSLFYPWLMIWYLPFMALVSCDVQE